MKLRNPKTLDKDTLSNVHEVIRNYKEDYPKSSLCEYLTDKDNREFYENKANELNRNESWWLEAFNLAYEVFDRLRVNSRSASEALEIIEEINTGDELFDKTSREIICYLSEKYCYDLSEEKRIMLYLLSEMVMNNYEVPEYKTNEVCDYVENEEKKIMNCSQQTKTIVFMLNDMGVNFKNTEKIKIAKFIKALTGRSLQNIRTRLDIDYDNTNDIKDAGVAAVALNDILPELSNKIRECIKPDI